MTVLKSPRPFIRSDIWFKDGNTILMARKVAFKVHRGQLERHSEVFSDLFSIPQPEDQEYIDNCPVVDLYDEPSDVFYLLKGLYDGIYFKRPSAADFPMIAAVLRLSTKYLIDHLREQCMARLDADWPPTLQEWDAREKRAFDEEGRYSPRDICPHPILVIKLARELGLDNLLPAAYYDLSRYGPRRIVSGTPTPPIPSLSTSKDTPMKNASQQSILHLGIEGLQVILAGRESGQLFIASFIEAELKERPISDSCSNRHLDAGRCCRESIYYVMLNVLRAVGGITHGRDADPLFTLGQMVDMLSRTDFTDGTKRCGLKICLSCKADLSECVALARKQVWDLIPEWFGLVRYSGKSLSNLDIAGC